MTYRYSRHPWQVSQMKKNFILSISIIYSNNMYLYDIIKLYVLFDIKHVILNMKYKLNTHYRRFFVNCDTIITIIILYCSQTSWIGLNKPFSLTRLVWGQSVLYSKMHKRIISAEMLITKVKISTVHYLNRGL